MHFFTSLLPYPRPILEYIITSVGMVGLILLYSFQKTQGLRLFKTVHHGSEAELMMKTPGSLAKFLNLKPLCVIITTSSQPIFSMMPCMNLFENIIVAKHCHTWSFFLKIILKGQYSYRTNRTCSMKTKNNGEGSKIVEDSNVDVGLGAECVTQHAFIR